MRVDQLIGYFIAVARIVPLGAANVVLIEFLVRLVEPTRCDLDPELVILAHDAWKPVGRVDQLEFGIDIDFAQLRDRDHRSVAIPLDIARRKLEGQALIGAVTELLHDVVRLGSVLRHIEAVTGEALQRVGRHAPDAVGGRQDGTADRALSFGQDLDKGGAIEAQRDGAPELDVVEGRHRSVDE